MAALDDRGELFSDGVVRYQRLCGERPFAGMSLVECAHRQTRSLAGRAGISGLPRVSAGPTRSALELAADATQPLGQVE